MIGKPHPFNLMTYKRPRNVFHVLWLVALLLCLHPGLSHADSVDITLPASVSFTVTNITQSTTGSPNPSTVSYDPYVPGTGTTLHISIKADSADFTRPVEAGGFIAAAGISWTAGAPSGGGSTFSGQLSSDSYTEVYQGIPTSNSFNLTWTLGSLDSSVRAGLHLLSATWKLESL